MLRTRRSSKLFQKAQSLIPGGVNSPVRAFKSVGRYPLFIKKASAAFVWDQDGNKFIDYVGSWGPMILGHANPGILKGIRTAVRSGTSFGAPSQMEVRLAELVTRLIPSVEMVRMTNSGTEATISALLLARSFTGRAKIIRFAGCAHGYEDASLIHAGPGAMVSAPEGPRMSLAADDDTLTARYNDLGSVRELLQRHPGLVGAVIVEPVASNMGCVPPLPGFLQGLRTLCDEHGALLIFDEVTTGFRAALGGAQELYGVRPDLTLLGKIIGGGLPVGAYGGRRDIMMQVAPAGPMYQAGTLSGNPLAMAAGYQTLRILSSNKLIYKRLEQHAGWLEEGLRDILRQSGQGYTINRVGTMFTLFFTTKPVTDYASAAASDTAAFARYFNAMLESGVYLPPSQFEAAFLSTAHTERIIDKTLRAAERALRHV